MKLFFLIIFISKIIYCQNNPVELLKTVQNKYKNIKDFSSDIKQSINTEKAITGKLFFKNPESYRIDLPMQLIISNGKTLWNYNKKQNKLIIDNYQKTNDNIFSINYLLFDVPAKSNVSSAMDNKFKKIILIPKDIALPYQRIEITLNENNLISKILAIDNTDITYQISFENYKLNQKFQTEFFEFSATEGIKVIDLR